MRAFAFLITPRRSAATCLLLAAVACQATLDPSVSVPPAGESEAGTIEPADDGGAVRDGGRDARADARADARTEDGDAGSDASIDDASVPTDAALDGPDAAIVDGGYPSTRNLSDPRMACTPTVCLVVFSIDLRRVLGMRVTPQGARLDPVPFSILEAKGTDSLYLAHQSIATDGSSFFVVTGGDYQALGARVSASGTVLDTTPIIINGDHAQTRWASYAAVLFTGGAYVVAWSRHPLSLGDEALVAARVSTAGVVLDSAPKTIRSSDPNIDTYMPTLVAGPSGQTLVAWHDFPDGKLYGVRLDASLQLIDANPSALSTTSDWYSLRGAFDGSSYLLLAVSAGVVHGMRVPTTLSPVPTMTVLSQGGYGAYEPALAKGSSGVMAAWQVSGKSGSPVVWDDVRARAFSTGQALGAAAPGSIAAAGAWRVSQEGPSLAWDGARFHVAYRQVDERPATDEIMTIHSGVLDAAGALVGTPVVAAP